MIKRINDYKETITTKRRALAVAVVAVVALKPFIDGKSKVAADNVKKVIILHSLRRGV
jgi:hypothetical protein